MIILMVAVFALGGFLIYRNANQFDLPRGEAKPLSESSDTDKGNNENDSVDSEIGKTLENSPIPVIKSSRQIFTTDGVKHSIPINEILSGGPPKDGIPSIDNPKFVSTTEADEFLGAGDVGLGIFLNGEARFYPYQILVWHEIVNDNTGDHPLLVTYCPLCATGVAFNPIVNGEPVKFGVSGKLWKSNLLMYNRSSDSGKESLWSQVLGEAVLGEFTGTKLAILRSDTMRYKDWKNLYPNTKVLSRDTGALRTYGSDPYGDYYTDEYVSFGASFTDDRLHPKRFVLGIEIDGHYKAYDKESLSEGITEDVFVGEKITIEKSTLGGIEIFVGQDKMPLPYVGGFWFSWLAVHPGTELFK